MWPTLLVSVSSRLARYSENNKVLEILPYRIRANGIMVQSLATNLALFFGQYVNPIGIDHAGWKYYFLYEALLVIALIVIYFYFIETRGATLEEISRTFDGVEVIDELKAKALEVKQVEVMEHVEEVHPTHGDEKTMGRSEL